MTILDILEASSLDWRYDHKPGEVWVCCPICIENGETPDTRYRLGVNYVTGQAHCFNCHWTSDNIVFTARSLAAAAEVDLRGTVVTQHKERTERAKVKPEPAPTYLTNLPEGYERFNYKSPFEKRALAYLMDRGITRDQIQRWEIGYAMVGVYAGRIIIPVVHDGKIAGVACRDYTGISDLRWKNSESLRGIFGMKGNKYATISEGAMDALRIETLVPGEDSIAMFGSNISDEQMEMLKRYTGGITYLGDHDAPGCKGARINCEDMAMAGLKVRVSIPARLDGSDPSTQSDELLLTRRRTAVAWSKATERLLMHREAFK